MRLAEICEMNLERGDKVYIEGSLQSKSLNDNKMSIVEILAERIQILTPKKIVSPGFESGKKEEEQKEDEIIEENEIIDEQ
jgi:single-stranded DNA-binding protein